MKPNPERAGMPAPIPAQLPVFEHKGKLVADSRDVALFVEKDHAHLLRDIRRYVKAMEKTLNPKLVSADYFIPATYIDPTGRELPNFYCTEMGCEMVANKMTGDKGIISRPSTSEHFTPCGTNWPGGGSCGRQGNRSGGA